MYEYNKLNGEEVVLISDDAVLKVDDKEENISVIVTNMRLLLFDYPNINMDYQEVLRISRGVNYISKKEIILELSIFDIKSIEKERDFDKYILKNNNYFYIRDEKVKEYLNKNLND
ncbi:MAG: hypothetical protein E7162_01155 [Firmicutes bacterium]|nr:hypothetical protein [Bacillota bacterium]